MKSERMETIAAALAAELGRCRQIDGRWAVETAHGILSTVRNQAEPGQAIRLRLERGRLHIAGDYPRPG